MHDEIYVHSCIIATMRIVEAHPGFFFRTMASTLIDR
jgi:hypothetical protein